MMANGFVRCRNTGNYLTGSTLRLKRGTGRFRSRSSRHSSKRKVARAQTESVRRQCRRCRAPPTTRSAATTSLERLVVANAWAGHGLYAAPMKASPLPSRIHIRSSTDLLRRHLPWSRKEKCHGQRQPPSASSPSSSLFLIGKNSRGQWVVQDHRGLRGGLFVDRAEALKFAMFENGNRPQAVIMVPDVLELDMSRKPRAVGEAASGTQAPVARAA